jgi:hypothetical protein
MEITKMEITEDKTVEEEITIVQREIMIGRISVIITGRERTTIIRLRTETTIRRETTTGKGDMTDTIIIREAETATNGLETIIIPVLSVTMEIREMNRCRETISLKNADPV